MAAWWLRSRALYADEIGEAFRRAGAPAPVLENVLASQRHWCDDVRTSSVRHAPKQRLVIEKPCRI